MCAKIVNISVSIQVAPTPETLQQTGALISQGATNTSPNTASLLTQLSDLTPLLNGTKTITTMVLSTGTVTVTTTAPHGYTIGDTILLTIAGVTPVAYNGTYLCTITGASTFTYALGGSPGSVTVQGVYTAEDVSELLQMATTFFGQGSNVSVFVLELGPGNVADGVAALTAYLTANPNTNYTPGATGYFYAYLVPREWDGNANFLALIAEYENPNAQTYFFVTTTLTNYSLYTNLMKCIWSMIESPPMGIWSANALTAISYSGGQVTAATTTAHGVAVGQWFQISGVTPTGYNGWWQAQPGTTGSTLVYNVSATLGVESLLGTLVASYYANAGVVAALPGTQIAAGLEFSCAAAFYWLLAYNPSNTNLVGPFAFKFLFGVTPFPVRGFNALLTTLQSNNVNVVGTGAEGGISNTIIQWGTTEDGNDMSYWYAIDWLSINVNVNVANAVINGSNNPVNPLYYNQPGINFLQSIIAQTVADGVAFGMVLGNPTQTEFDGPTLGAALNAGTYAGQSVINAVPFLIYSQDNPGDFKIGRYSGFSIIFTPSRGFIQININIVATELIAL